MCGTPLKNKGPFELNGMVKKHKGIDTENVNAKFACDDSCTLKFKRSSLYIYYILFFSIGPSSWPTPLLDTLCILVEVEIAAEVEIPS